VWLGLVDSSLVYCRIEDWVIGVDCERESDFLLGCKAWHSDMLLWSVARRWVWQRWE
jgi:hypothetical protein